MQLLTGRYGIYKKPPRKPIYKENSEEAKKLFSICENDLEKKIVQLIFIDGYTADEVGYEIGYSTRQIYRIKKKFNELVKGEKIC